MILLIEWIMGWMCFEEHMDLEEEEIEGELDGADTNTAY